MKFAEGHGTLYLIDTSVLARTRIPSVQNVVAGLILEGVAATCVTIDLEVGYSGRNLAEVRHASETRPSHYRNLDLTEPIAARARATQLHMAARGHHRAAGVIDLLTAAVAAHYGATLLHYDSDFDHIAAVTGQSHLWIAPRGTLD